MARAINLTAMAMQQQPYKVKVQIWIRRNIMRKKITRLRYKCTIKQ